MNQRHNEKRSGKSRPAAKSPRIDHWVKAAYPSLSGRQVDEAIERGLVTNMRGKLVQKGERISEPTALVFKPLDAHLAKLRAGNPELVVDVLREEESFFIVDKPAGMPSHPLSLFDLNTVTHWLFARYPAARESFADLQPIVTPHRLDTGTSGILVVAKDPASFAQWREAFRKKKVIKRYLAWCWGRPESRTFEINFSVAHSSRKRGLMAIPARGDQYKPPVLEAQSIVTVRETRPELGIFLAEVECYTGVTHQVRVHLASFGHPLVGDSAYDSLAESRALKPDFHELRATELEGLGFQFRAPSDDFVGRYRS